MITLTKDWIHSHVRIDCSYSRTGLPKNFDYQSYKNNYPWKWCRINVIIRFSIKNDSTSLNDKCTFFGKSERDGQSFDSEDHFKSSHLYKEMVEEAEKSLNEQMNGVLFKIFKLCSSIEEITELYDNSQIDKIHSL